VLTPLLPVTPHDPDHALAPKESTEPFAIRARIQDPKSLGPMKPPPPGRAEDILGYTILQVKAQALGALPEAGRSEISR